MMESTVTFFGDIGFDRAHRNVRDFENEASRNSWFYNQLHDIFICNYDKVNRSLKVEMDYTQAMAYSYCIVEIVNQKPLYCFVDDVTLVNDRTVAFSLSVDVWQTYLFQFTLGRCFVTRSHMDRWTKASTTPVMQIYPNEGIDGFQTVSSEKQFVQTSNGYDYIWFVMARTVTSGTTSYIEYDVSPISIDYPLSTIHWVSSSEPMPTVHDILDGTLFTKFGIDPNSVVFVGITPFLPLAVTWSKSGMTFTVSSISVSAGDITNVKIGSLTMLKWTGANGEPAGSSPYKALSITIDKPTKPTSYDANDSQTNEPMMYMSPVRSVVAYTGQGVPVWSAPDDLLMNSDGTLSFKVTGIPGAGGFNSRVFIGDDFATADALGRAFDIPSDPVDAAGNNWLTYVATERDTTRQLQAMNIQRGAVDRIASSVMGYQDPLSLVTSLIGAGVSAVSEAHYASKELAINEQGIRNQTNGALSSGSGTGSLYMYGAEARLVITDADVTTKKIFFDKIRMEGYTVNKYMTPNLRSRYWFNYILTIGAVVKGSFSESVRSELASIFNGGVTIWHDNAEMDTEKCNIERALL